MSDSPTSTRPPITDSPWFWVYTFATFALVMLVLIGPKFQSRQSQEERKFQGRTRAQQQKLGEEPQGELSEPGRTWLTLTPIYLLLGTMIAMGWGVLWWQRWRATINKRSPDGRLSLRESSELANGE